MSSTNSVVDELNRLSNETIGAAIEGITLDEGYRIDLLVERKLLLELKSIDKVQPIHTAQVLTYLKMTGLRMALILNCNVLLMRSGIKRIVNQL
jgi:GxxExxY protein